MTALGKRTVYALLASLAFLSILLRIPLNDHQTGADTYIIHALATSISDSGYIPWILNPLGYFGWYPLSYPSAGPIVISSLSVASDLTGEGAILALSMIYGVVGVLGAFMMARTFRRDDVFALLVAFTFAFAPRFITFTQWSASTRNLFMVLIPFFLWSFVRAYRRSNWKNLTLVAVILMLMLAAHRLTILLAVVVLAFVAAYAMTLAHRVLRLRYPQKLLAPTVRRWMPTLVLLGIAAIAVGMLIGTPVLDRYTEGVVCTGETAAEKLCNLGVSISRSVGLALPFAFLGVFALVRQKNRGFLESFLILALLALIPTLFLRQYTGFYTAPFIALFAGMGLAGVGSVLRKRPRASRAAVVACMVIMGGFTVSVLNFEADRDIAMTSATYSTALYVRDLGDANLVSNDGLLAIRISSISGRFGLPIGGAGTISQSAELLIMGAYDASDVFDRERRIPLLDLTIEDDSPFVLDGVDARDVWVTRILQQDVNDVTVQGQYNLGYYVERDDIRGHYAAFGKIYSGAQFAYSIYLSRCKLFDGGLEDVYLAFPIGQ